MHNTYTALNCLHFCYGKNRFCTTQKYLFMKYYFMKYMCVISKDVGKFSLSCFCKPPIDTSPPLCIAIGTFSIFLCLHTIMHLKIYVDLDKTKVES